MLYRRSFDFFDVGAGVCGRAGERGGYRRCGFRFFESVLGGRSSNCDGSVM